MKLNLKRDLDRPWEAVFTITGKTGQPIRGAVVTIMAVSQQRTGRGGVASFPLGHFNYTIEHPKYEPESGSFSVRSQ
jgi:hypothetical protein